MVHAFQIKIAILVLGCMSLFCAAPGWDKYKAAMSCHFSNGKNCEELYEQAIRENPKLPGVYSSYASHLMSKGTYSPKVKELYQTETRLHPQSQKAIAVVNSPDTSVTQSVPQAADSGKAETIHE